MMEPDVIVAFKPCCNRVVFMAVNLPHVIDKGTQKTIAELVIEGCRIEHLSVVDARKAAFGCDCGKTSPLPLPEPSK